MLELVNVTKKFRGGFALGPINLKVNDNEILVMIGPTGSGKTTILNLISGLLKPDSGSICINGVDITALPVEFRNIGYIFQNPSLFPHLNVYENITFGLSNKRRRRRADRDIDDLEVTKLIKGLGISHLVNRYIQGLSGGEIQKVSLARMLVTRPRVMLMDEPLTHLDNLSKRKLRLQLRRILKERQIMPTIYVTHFEEDVYSLADSVSILQNGLIERTAKLETMLTYQNNNNNSTSVFLSNVFSDDARGGGGNYLEGNVVKSKDGVTIFKMGPHLLEVLGDYSIGCKVGIIVRPEDIILSNEMVKTSARNVVRAKVLKIDNNHNAGVSDIHLITEGSFHIISRITYGAKIDLGIKPDDVVCAIFKASSPHVVRED